ncbi:MAG: YesL family protein [Oscillospiraceae bacterium]|nr:YesL family protein [Oscillospiraceae bacterium]MBQ8978760.1 YesL family protein [Oscillospiraceae bacterium]
MKIFSPEGKLYKFMVRFTDCVKLELLWLLFSLPIVTLGASTAAAFSVTLAMVREEEGKIGADFFRAFKANLKQGIAMTFITLLCIWAVYLDLQLIDTENGVIFLVTAVVAIYVFTFSLLYAYPLIARYENTLLRTIRNSFRLSMKFFVRSLLLVVITALECAVFMWSSTTIIIGVIVGPVLVMYTISYVANGIFEKVEQDGGSE